MNNFWDALSKTTTKRKRTISIDKKYEEDQARLIISSAKPEMTDIILDAGCGGGRWTFLFAQHATHVHGIDNARESLEFAKKQQKKLKLKNVTFHPGSIDKLPYPDNTFDITFTSIVLQHVLEEKKFRKATSELIRVTKPGGKIILSEIVKSHQSHRKGYIAIRSAQEYIDAFKQARCEQVIGVRFPYLNYALRVILRKIYVKKKYGDVRDSYAVWDAIGKSKAFPLINALFSINYYISKPFNWLAHKIPRLSPENIIILEKT